MIRRINEIRRRERHMALWSACRAAVAHSRYILKGRTLECRTWDCIYTATRAIDERLGVRVVRVGTPVDCSATVRPTIGRQASGQRLSFRGCRVWFTVCIAASTINRLPSPPSSLYTTAAVATAQVVAAALAAATVDDAHTKSNGPRSKSAAAVGALPQ